MKYSCVKCKAIFEAEFDDKIRGFIVAPCPHCIGNGMVTWNGDEEE